MSVARVLATIVLVPLGLVALAMTTPDWFSGGVIHYGGIGLLILIPGGIVGSALVAIGRGLRAVVARPDTRARPEPGMWGDPKVSARLRGRP